MCSSDLPVSLESSSWLIPGATSFSSVSAAHACTGANTANMPASSRVMIRVLYFFMVTSIPLVSFSKWSSSYILDLIHLMSHRAGLGITVRKKAWGRGVGTALMERLIAHAREQELEIIELQVRSDNLRAIRLYEKFGFQKIGHYPKFIKIGDVYASCELMNLYL